MNDTIELCKKKLNDALNGNSDWNAPYDELIKAVYEQPVLFFALSRDNYSPETGTSSPLISTKDFNGQPALYVFSDVDIAAEWMRYYRHTTDDMRYGLIGAVEKKTDGLLSLFQVARYFGTKHIMLDEGNNYVGIDMDRFFHTNGIDTSEIRVNISKQEADSLIEGSKQAVVHFTPISCISLTRNK